MAAASRTAEVYEALKEELLDCAYAPDRKLAIDQLASQFGVSAGAVREALSRLTSDRLVVSLPQRGFVVASVSRRDLIDLTAVRIEIETRCLGRSIARGDLEWEGRLLGIWHRLSRTLPSEDKAAKKEWARLHSQFHDELLSCCDSLWWLHLRDQLYMQAERYRRMILPHARTSRDINAEHQKILDRALAGDAEQACAALRDHLQLTTDILLTSGALAPAVEDGKRELVQGGRYDWHRD
ncbi:GntR family transcriptional regulator [Martelella soudanensis]|uniref:GntR family transcriptional regulator n=1 Tax=unclassified Martelella TaxID=2629616 RepID=UPI0015DEBE86|nr:MULTISPECIES: GntR family transcriptional regulator [unclassified Martelella]